MIRAKNMWLLLERDTIKGSSIRNAPDVMVRVLHCILTLRQNSAREPGRTTTDGNETTSQRALDPREKQFKKSFAEALIKRLATPSLLRIIDY